MNTKEFLQHRISVADLTDLQNLINRAILHSISPKGIIECYIRHVCTMPHITLILKIEDEFLNI